MDMPDLKLISAIIITSVAKWLLTEEAPDEKETPAQKLQRRRRAMGGIIAGIVAAYYGNEPVIRWVDVLTQDDRIVVAIVLALTGEHVMRWLMALGPEALAAISKRLFGGGGS